ncbi:MAG: peptidylprolyl isomerase [Desulfotomaculaceae bacterium]|nr:peptidylprolyl isomerase [Desulfotomaculaceae bacterium]MDD4766578.1 peptidylprolyl isomerase [Desulfotomaculaceae bacterium]
MKIKKCLVMIALLALTVFVFTGCGENVVAEVNGEKITMDELNRQVNELKETYEQQGMDFSGDNGQSLLDSLQKDILTGMIEQKIVLQEARNLVTLGAEDIQQKLQPLKEQFPTEDNFKSFLEQTKMSEEEVAYILALQDEVTKDVPAVSEDDVKKYYDDNPVQFTQPEQLEVRHILFFVNDGTKEVPTQHTDDEARQMAVDVIAQLNQGQDFAGLAKEKSEDTGTKEEGGLYTATESGTVPGFYTAASALAVGEYTAEPVKTDYGYHVIKLEKIIPAEQQPFAEVKEVLATHLWDQAKQQKFNQFMKEAMDKAVIVNKLDKNQGNQEQ